VTGDAALVTIELRQENPKTRAEQWAHAHVFTRLDRRSKSLSHDPHGSRDSRKLLYSRHMTVLSLGAARAAGVRRYAPLAGLALVLALAALWSLGRVVDRSGTAASDSQLVADLEVARSTLASDAAAAGRQASALARLSRTQQALAQNDAEGLRALVRAHPGALLVSAGGAAAGALPALGVRETVDVLSDGRNVGRVTVAAAIDDAFLARVRASAATGTRDLIVVTESGRVVAGPLPRGTPLAVGSARDIGVRGHSYRAVGSTLVNDRPDLHAVGLSPKSGALVAGWRLPLAVLATLALIAAFIYWAAGLLRPREPAPRTGARRARDPKPGSRHRDAPGIVALLGETLAATHDPEALLAVIIDAAIEATGAVGGKLVGEGGTLITSAGRSSSESLTLLLDTSEPGGSSLVLFAPPGWFNPEARDVADWLAVQAGIAFENARLHRVVQQQAITDELTGLPNRRQFMAKLEAELTRVERFGGPVSVLLSDLDDFKRINDRFGHRTGDEVLKAFGRAIRRCVRDTDLPARLGGEEFAVLLTETDAAGARRFAERLRSEFRNEKGLPDRVTASYGISSYPTSGSAEALLVDGDVCLYQAKARGKDRIVVSGEEG
jgi:diguanylate cyclase (GGDEF)-like protein